MMIANYVFPSRCALVMVLMFLLTSRPGSKAAVITIPDTAMAAQTYRVLTFYKDKLTWHQARAVCEALPNGHLVSILDKRILTIIGKLAGERWSTDWDHAWTGLHWENSANRRWADNVCTVSTNDNTYFKSNDEMVQEADKNCYQLDQGTIELERKSCTEEHVFICQTIEVATTVNYISHPFSMMPAIPPTDCPSLCSDTLGCFLYHQLVGSDQCVLAIADTTAVSYLKGSTPILDKMGPSNPSIPSGALSGENPTTCSTFELTLAGATLTDISQLNVPDTGITCPTSTTVTTTTDDPQPATTTTTIAAQPTTTTTIPSTVTTTISTSTSPRASTSTSPSPSTAITTTTAAATTTTATSSSASSLSSSSSSSSSDPPTTATVTFINDTSPSTFTNKSINHQIEDIISDLKIDARSTSKFKARLSSAYDGRKSSQYIGLGGIMILSLIALAIVVFDIPTVIENIKMVWGETPKKDLKKKDLEKKDLKKGLEKKVHPSN